MWETIWSLLAALGGLVVAGGVLTSAAFWLFKKFGEQWLKSRFAQQLEAFKHAQQKEIEEQRYKINALLDRAVKLHQREFDVLPDAWARLNDTYGTALSVVSPIQGYPDPDHMSGPELDAFLSSSELEKWKQDELKAQENKFDYYRKRISVRRWAKAWQVAQDNHFFLRKNGIFILQNMRQQFDQIDQLIWDALIEHQANRDTRPRDTRKATELHKEGEKLLKRLEGEVQSRLWNAESVGPSR